MNSGMNPGDLRDKITVSRIVTVDDGMGGGDPLEPAPILNCWAKVVAKASRDGIIGGRDLEVRTHEVTIRLGSVEPLQDDVVMWREKKLRVKAVRPDYGKAICIMDCILEA